MALPDGPEVKVWETTTSANPVSVFAIPAGGDTVGMAIDVRLADGPPPGTIRPLSVSVLGSTGQALTDDRISTPSGEVEIQLGDSSTGAHAPSGSGFGAYAREVLVRVADAASLGDPGVSTPATSLSTSPNSTAALAPSASVMASLAASGGSIVLGSYVLSVRRELRATPATGSDAPGASATTAATASNTLTPVTSPGPTGFGVDTTDIGVLPTGEGDGAAALPRAVAAGPLPARGVAPLGGILSDQVDPVPVVDRAASAVVDLALLDLPAEDLAPVVFAPAQPRADGGEGDAGMTVDLTALVAVRGTGGLPLYAPGPLSKQSSLRESPPTPETTETAAPTALAEFSTPTVGLPREDAEVAGARRRSGSRMATMAGMTVALTLAGGLLVPTPTDPRRKGGHLRSWLRDRLPRRPGTPDSDPE